MALGAEYPFLSIIWSMILFGLFFMWIWIVITTFADIFRRDDMSGGMKVLWSCFIIFLPFLGVFVYLIARPKMTEQDQRMMAEYEQQQRRAVGYSSADEIAKLTELRKQGALSDAEFEELKRKAI